MKQKCNILMQQSSLECSPFFTQENVHMGDNIKNGSFCILEVLITDNQ